MPGLSKGYVDGVMEDDSGADRGGMKAERELVELGQVGR